MSGGYHSNGGLARGVYPEEWNDNSMALKIGEPMGCKSGRIREYPKPASSRRSSCHPAVHTQALLVSDRIVDAREMALLSASSLFSSGQHYQMTKCHVDSDDEISYHENNHECFLQAGVQEICEEAEQGFSACH
jgi:hypothetical protein